jgi:hypothetical protein
VTGIAHREPVRVEDFGESGAQHSDGGVEVGGGHGGASYRVGAVIG